VCTNGRLPRVQNDVEVVNTRWGELEETREGLGEVGCFGGKSGLEETGEGFGEVGCFGGKSG
ncbi:hypothetical protein Tco_0292893, partial [Tanacetum coccineum]